MTDDGTVSPKKKNASSYLHRRQLWNMLSVVAVISAVMLLCEKTTHHAQHFANVVTEATRTITIVQVTMTLDIL